MKQTSISNAVEVLFCKLEILSTDHDELTDTDVREAIHLTLNYFFVWGRERDKFPISYRMFSREGNHAIRKIVEEFICSSKSNPGLSDIPPGQARLNLLQNPSIKTPGGCFYDEFIGHVDNPLSPDSLPDDLFYEDELVDGFN